MRMSISSCHAISGPSDHEISVLASVVLCPPRNTCLLQTMLVTLVSRGCLSGIYTTACSEVVHHFCHLLGGVCRTTFGHASNAGTNSLPYILVAVQDEDWRPSITVNQILKGIQQLLDTPNEHSPAQADAYMFFTQRTEDYRKKVLAQARHYSIDRVN